MFNFYSKPETEKEIIARAGVERLLILSEQQANAKTREVTLNQLIDGQAPTSSIMSIPNFRDADLTTFRFTCVKCNYKWSIRASDLKVNKLDQLIAYCPECFDPPAEITILPTLQQVSQAYAQRANQENPTRNY